MQQVVQEVRSGRTTVREIPDPVAGAGQVVVATAASLVSAGTERYVVELARKSLIGKARERPDHVRRVLQKVKQEGLLMTAQQVQAKLDEPMPLGYSSAGVVLECGRGVQEFKPGDRVATAGPHAGVVSVGRNLCAKVPDEVTFEQAAYTSVASIGLEGVRLARATLGERVLVIGLGLIGQIASRCSRPRAAGSSAPTSTPRSSSSRSSSAPTRWASARPATR
jgi:NADPH:quinone reductase-like Zn-dependent oxidoreductase